MGLSSQHTFTLTSNWMRRSNWLEKFIVLTSYAQSVVNCVHLCCCLVLFLVFFCLSVCQGFHLLSSQPVGLLISCPFTSFSIGLSVIECGPCRLSVCVSVGVSFSRFCFSLSLQPVRWSVSLLISASNLLFTQLLIKSLSLSHSRNHSVFCSLSHRSLHFCSHLLTHSVFTLSVFQSLNQDSVLYSLSLHSVSLTQQLVSL